MDNFFEMFVVKANYKNLINICVRTVIIVVMQLKFMFVDNNKY